MNIRCLLCLLLATVLILGGCASRRLADAGPITTPGVGATHEQNSRDRTTDSVALNNRALVKSERGELDGAESDLAAAVAYSSGPDRSFYLRRLGDVLARKAAQKRAAGKPNEAADLDFWSAADYWKAVEWNPWDRVANERIIEHLRQSRSPIQIANYLRFLLEYRQTDWVPTVAAMLLDATQKTDLAAATAAALIPGARVVQPETLDEAAAPFIDRAGEPGAELNAVLHGQRHSFDWIATHMNATLTTGDDPASSFRALAEAVGDGAALRGDQQRAVQQYLLALQMPGANETDVDKYIEYLGEYGTLPLLRSFVEEREPTITRRRAVDFDTAAAVAYALHHACGDEMWGVRHHVARLYAAGGSPPAAAEQICPLPYHETCVECLGVSSAKRGSTILIIPELTCQEDRECALDVLAVDYRSAHLPGIIIEVSAARMQAAREVRTYLIERGVSPDAIRIATTSKAGRSIRLRLAANH